MVNEASRRSPRVREEELVEVLFRSGVMVVFKSGIGPWEPTEMLTDLRYLATCIQKIMCTILDMCSCP